MTVHYEGTSADAIASSVERAIRAEELAAGSGLPPIRSLARDLGVSPATVAAAYRMLRERGIVETAGRHGTRVRSRSTLTPRSALVPAVPEGARDLSHGGPDLRLVPGLARHLRALDARAVGYDRRPRADVLSLARERLAADGIDTTAVMFTSGALDGIERVLGAHLASGDGVVVEDPGWGNLLDLVTSMGLRPIGVPVDDDGLRPEPFERALAAGARAVVFTSRAQNPFGSLLSADRAAALRPLLAAHPDVVLVEDDHSAELTEDPHASLVGVTERWSYIRSVSKPYGPDLRMATVAGDEDTIARAQGRQRLGAGWVSTVLQRLVASMWEDDGVRREVAAASRSYAERRTGLLDALDAVGVPAYGRSGLNVWVPVADETTTVAHLRDAGWAVAPGAAYRIATAPAVRITISDLDVDELPAVAGAVAEVVGGRRTGAHTGV